MWQTTGYQNQKLFLESSLRTKKYSHAYLFCGPDPESKKALAIEFAEKILGEQGSKISPDLIVVDQEKLKIEDIRGLISDLSLKPYQNSHKVAIINAFENITEEGANSVLKTLEEPSPSTIIILLVRNKLAVLPTIASRCQVIYFSAKNVVAGIKTESDVFLQQLAGKSKADRLVSIRDFADKDTAELLVIFESWIVAQRGLMLAGNAHLYLNLQSLLDSLYGLKQNLNKKLVLEKLFLNLK